MINGKRIVFLRSNPISPDPRVEKEARTLAKSGFVVSVVGWDREDKFEKYEVKDFGKIYRIKVRAGFGKGLKNIIHLIKWQIALFSWLSRNRKIYDCIHACDFDTVIPALACKLLYRKKVVYDIFDFYADMLRNTPKILRIIIRKIDLFLIGFADAVIIADESRKKQIEGSHPKELVVIYNSPPDEISLLQKEINKNANLVIAYVGLLQKERGIFEIIDVVKKHSNWKLILGGFGGDEDEILSCAKSIPNVEFVGRVPYERTLEIYNSSDVLFATYDPKIPNHRYSSANKLFEAMMLGKPIIVAKNTGMDLLVEKYNLGFVVEYGNKDEIEKALMEIYNWNDNKYNEFSMNSRNIYNQYFSWHIMEKRLIELYRGLLKC